MPAALLPMPERAVDIAAVGDVLGARTGRVPGDP